jgi:hypothetical protein
MLISSAKSLSGFGLVLDARSDLEGDDIGNAFTSQHCFIAAERRVSPDGRESFSD